MNRYRGFLIIGLAAILTGCSSTPVPDPDPSMETTEAGSRTGLYRGDSSGHGGALADAPSDELGIVIYFDFDQSELRPEYVDLLARHARRLSGNAGTQARLEGHADERGSREYNVGLGERRSQTVRRILLAQGATSAQLSTISFGEERPAMVGSDEESYALNRRVEIKYLN